MITRTTTIPQMSPDIKFLPFERRLPGEAAFESSSSAACSAENSVTAVRALNARSVGKRRSMMPGLARLMEEAATGAPPPGLADDLWRLAYKRGHVCVDRVRPDLE